MIRVYPLDRALECSKDEPMTQLDAKAKIVVSS